MFSIFLASFLVYICAIEKGPSWFVHLHDLKERGEMPMNIDKEIDVEANDRRDDGDTPTIRQRIS